MEEEIRNMNDLTVNIDKLHTTPMGEERIRRNLSLQAMDVVLWCKDFVLRAESITRKGKNFYVHGDGIVVTVNAYSFTVITAHGGA
jgi:hypothetical protein